MRIDRRKALALLGLGAATPAVAQSSAVSFRHGVASGDPKQDRVVLWTRITPEKPGADIACAVDRNAALASHRGPKHVPHEQANATAGEQHHEPGDRNRRAREALSAIW